MIQFSRRSAIITFSAVALCVGGYTWWAIENTEWPPKRTPATYSQIEEGLFMGGAVDKPPPGTRAVLNLCEDKDPYQVEVQRWDQIRDGAPAPSLDWLKKNVHFVDEQRRAGLQTYVHCHGGVSRAGMVTMAYLMMKYNWTRDETLAFIKQKRPQVNPNEAFMELLSAYEIELRIKKAP